MFGIGCSHKWEFFEKFEKDTFLGKPFSRSYPAYRRCTKCKLVQEDGWTEGSGSSWDTLDYKRAYIFNNLTPEELEEQSLKKV